MDGIGGPELRARHGAAKKHDLALAAEKVFAGETILDAAVQARAIRWLPAEMRFVHGVDEKPAEEGGWTRGRRRGGVAPPPTPPPPYPTKPRRTCPRQPEPIVPDGRRAPRHR